MENQLQAQERKQREMLEVIAMFQVRDNGCLTNAGSSGYKEKCTDNAIYFGANPNKSYQEWD